MAAQRIPSPSHPFVDEQGRITPPWYTYLQRLLTAGRGVAPGDGPYIIGEADPDLPDARVATDSPSIDFDIATAGQLKAHVIVDVAGALDGGTLADLAVRVDGVTIDVNGSNQLEVISGGQYCEPLTNGDEPATELIFALGDVIMVCV